MKDDEKVRLQQIYGRYQARPNGWHHRPPTARRVRRAEERAAQKRARQSGAKT